MPRLKKIGNLNVSLDEISQEIDLSELLGRKPTSNEKRLFAEIAIDTINTRTLDGKTVNGGSFKPYSAAYAKEKGVTRDSVDLFLEGDMLESISRRSSKEKSSTVFIQMEKGLQTKKAFNHNTGDTLPKREFFGITRNEAENIANQIAEQQQETTRVTLADLRNALSLLDIEQTE